MPDAFTNPAHVHFALKVTFAAMFCYIVYEAIDWSGIHTAFITCTFIALESTECDAVQRCARIVGCVIGGALALFSIVFLMPHMETIASLVVLVACASAIAGWVAPEANGSVMPGYRSHSLFSTASSKAMRPIQISITSAIASLEFFSVSIVTGLVFHYIWPERTIDRFRDALRAALRQLAKLLEIPRPDVSIEKAEAKADALIAETSRSFDRRAVTLT